MGRSRFKLLAGWSVLALCVDQFTAPRLLAQPLAAEYSSERTASYDKIDTYIEQRLARLKIPGAVLAIVEGDKIMHVRGFGTARPNGTAPSAQTPFFLGSLSKSSTALAVMQLVADGKVDLDTPVQHYLPWFRVADSRMSALITVRHLVNQTSGLPLVIGLFSLADFDNRPDACERQARGLTDLRT